MYKVERLFLKYFAGFFVVSLFLFTSISLIFSFIQIINNEEITKGISLYYLFKSLLYLTPSIISTSLPFCMVFSIFLTVGELSQRGEIIAIKVGGFSYFEITRTFLVFVILLTIFSTKLIYEIAPKYSLLSREYIRIMINRITNINLKDNSFETISSFKIYSKKVKKTEIKDVLLFREAENTYNTNSFIKIKAEKGNYEKMADKGIKITLYNGKIYQINNDKPDVYNNSDFSSYTTYIPFEIYIRKKNFINIYTYLKICINTKKYLT